VDSNEALCSNARQLSCLFDCTCRYGMPTSANCTLLSTPQSAFDWIAPTEDDTPFPPADSITDQINTNLTNNNSSDNFTCTLTCQYCFQVPEELHICKPLVLIVPDEKSHKVAHKPNCSSTRTGDFQIVVCTVPDNLVCLGSRTFQKYIKCKFTTGYKWSTAFLLSVFLGGFGADRFYLGYIGWGMFKLLSLGGLGVWTLIDVILVGAAYITPHDGSLYEDL